MAKGATSLTNLFGAIMRGVEIGRYGRRTPSATASDERLVLREGRVFFHARIQVTRTDARDAVDQAAGRYDSHELVRARSSESA